MSWSRQSKLLPSQRGDRHPSPTGLHFSARFRRLRLIGIEVRGKHVPAHGARRKSTEVDPPNQVRSELELGSNGRTLTSPSLIVDAGFTQQHRVPVRRSADPSDRPSRLRVLALFPISATPRLRVYPAIDLGNGFPFNTKDPLDRSTFASTRLCASPPLPSKKWSGRRDSNSRPLAPHASALPGYATARTRERSGSRIACSEASAFFANPRAHSLLACQGPLQTGLMVAALSGGSPGDSSLSFSYENDPRTGRFLGPQ